MKKLLSLLSVLTISGTAVPTTIAASPYQKEETIKNSEINYQQANNLEKLIRNKREKINLEQKSFEELINIDLKIEDLISLIGLNLELDLNFNDAFKKDKNDDSNILFIKGPRDRIETFTFNLNKNEPNNFSKFSILYNEKTFTKISWNSIVEETNEFDNIIKNKDIKDLILNVEPSKSNPYTPLLYTMGSQFLAHFWARADIFFRYYWKDNKCYLEFSVRKSWNTDLSSIDPDISTYFGSGFKFSGNKNPNIFRMKDWLNNFNIWRKEVKRQKIEDLSSFSEAQKRSWKGDKYNELLDKIDSLKDKIEISRLSTNFRQLQNDLNSLKNTVEKLIEQINNPKPSFDCSNISALTGGATSLIPAVGAPSSAVFTIISAACAITKA